MKNKLLMALLVTAAVMLAACDSKSVLPTSSAQTSIPGRIWHTQHSGTLQFFGGVAWSGSQFVAVGDNGAILTSPNGRTWTAQNSGTSQDLHDVVWSGSQFVAVGTNGAILTSP